MPSLYHAFGRPSASVWLCATLALAAAHASASDDVLALPFETYRLANGMQVILHQDRAVPLVAVDVWYHVGSGDEVPGKSGFAHLFEHMMFQGAIHIGEDAHFEVLKRIGGTGINGSTTYDRTNYYEVVPAHQLETALWLESDRMGYMLPVLTQKSLSNQRDVVRNERRQSYDTQPYGKERYAISEALYAEGHSYRHLVMGLHEDIEAASVGDVRAFFNTWYIPANATLTLAGDFDLTQAKQLVEKWFGDFPASTQPQHRAMPPTEISDTRLTVSDDYAKLRRVHLAWHSPKSFGDGDAELDILGHVLANPGTGRLYKTLVYEKQWAQTVSARQDGNGFSGIFDVIVDLRPDADLAAVEAVVEAELARATTEAVGRREFDRAVVDIESSSIWRLEGLMARAETLQLYNHYCGDPGWIGRDLQRYRSTSPEGVLAIAARYLRAGRVEMITLPAAPGGAAPAKRTTDGDQR
ncbi:MAG: insulinase family protein [Planctomycetes bacterium]|nr:insulinase family protein [Planctomycetota bacterium]